MEALTTPPETYVPHPSVRPTILVLRAGTRVERTRQTLDSVLTAGDSNVRVLLSGSARSALSARSDRRISFVGTDTIDGNTLRDAALVVQVEDGAVLPARWRETIHAHLVRSPTVDVLAASTNHSSGPERLPGDVLSEPLRRFDPVQWDSLTATMRERWPGVTENTERVCSPLIAVRPSASNVEALRRQWVNPDPSTPLALHASARVRLCWDLPVWREPGRSAARQAVHVGGFSRRPGSEALRWFNERVSDVGRSHGPAELLSLAAVAVRTGRFEDAVQFANGCLSVWPDHVDARLWLAEAHIMAGRGESARQRLDALQQSMPLSNERRAHLLACLGESWRQEGGEQSERCLEASLALDPFQPLALDALGMVELEAGRFDSALESFQRAVRADPTYAAAWANLGRAWAMEGQHQRAREALVRALAIQPGQRDARELLGRIARSQ